MKTFGFVLLLALVLVTFSEARVSNNPDSRKLGGNGDYDYAALYARCCGDDVSGCSCPVRNVAFLAGWWSSKCEKILAKSVEV